MSAVYKPNLVTFFSQTIYKFINKFAVVLRDEARSFVITKICFISDLQFYCLIEFKAEPNVINTLETGFRRDEKVIRFMTVKLDKYAAQYAEKRRNKFAKKEEA